MPEDMILAIPSAAAERTSTGTRRMNFTGAFWRSSSRKAAVVRAEKRTKALSAAWESPKAAKESSAPMPPSTSTTRYLGEMEAPQQAALPLRTIQEAIGTLCRTGIGVPQ